MSIEREKFSPPVCFHFSGNYFPIIKFISNTFFSFSLTIEIISVSFFVFDNPPAIDEVVKIARKMSFDAGFLRLRRKARSLGDEIFE